MDIYDVSILRGAVDCGRLTMIVRYPLFLIMSAMRGIEFLSIFVS